MTDRNYTTTITVNQNPAVVFAVINNVCGWWSKEIEGNADKIGETFKHHYEDLHRCEIAVKDLVRGEKVVWTVLDNYFSFTEDKTEWTGTDIVFEIASRGDKTEIKFTHVGLVPDYECYTVCAAGWQPSSTAVCTTSSRRDRANPMSASPPQIAGCRPLTKGEIHETG